MGFNLKTAVVQLEKELRAAFSIRKCLIPVFFGISCWIKPSQPSQNIPDFCCYTVPSAKGSFGSFGSLDCVTEDKVLRMFCGREHGKCPDSSPNWDGHRGGVTISVLGVTNSVPASSSQVPNHGSQKTTWESGEQPDFGSRLLKHPHGTKNSPSG